MNNTSQGVVTIEMPFRITKDGIVFRNNTAPSLKFQHVPLEAADAICQGLNDAFKKGFNEGAVVMANIPRQPENMSDDGFPIPEGTKKPKHRKTDFFHAHAIVERLNK